RENRGSARALRRERARLARGDLVGERCRLRRGLVAEVEWEGAVYRFPEGSRAPSHQPSVPPPGADVGVPADAGRAGALHLRTERRRILAVACRVRLSRASQDRIGGERLASARGSVARWWLSRLSREC